MKTTFSLIDADTRLEALIALRDVATGTLRAFEDAAQPRLLSAGALHYEETVIWHSLSGARDAVAPDRVLFELELSIDKPIPESLVVTCAIGRSLVRHRVQASTKLTWSAALADVQNPRNKRVDAIRIELEVVSRDAAQSTAK
jgi:hypothetical protein